MRLQEVRASALALSSKSRAKLATDLLQSLEGELTSNLPGSKIKEEDWKAEISQRMEAHEKGEAPIVSGNKIDKWLRQRMK